MEQLNYVELRGTVGSVRVSKAEDTRVVRLTLVTCYLYKLNGDAIIETTWHDVFARESDNIAPIDNLKKGSKVHLVGRIRNLRFTDSDGEERYHTEILANSLKILDETEPLLCQQKPDEV